MSTAAQLTLGGAELRMDLGAERKQDRADNLTIVYRGLLTRKSEEQLQDLLLYVV